MKKRIGIFLLIVIASVFLFLHFPAKSIHQETQTQKPAWNVCFSPEGGCTKVVVDALDQAKSSILVQAYSFTSEPIAEALIKARQRGLKVEAILDRSQVRAKNGQVKPLVEAGVPVSIDASHSIAHNKVMVIDGATVITGSFNFSTNAAIYNAENLLIINDPSMATQYAANWQKHRGHSEPYETWLVLDATKQGHHKRRSQSQ